jgi:alkylation response protein AidB-like acyl-CoA dehydrogenase
VAHVTDKMLHACGGSGYKRDMELERYLRDGKADWVMGPTNETKKLDAKGKRVLAEKLLAQAAEDEAKEPIGR